MKNHTQKDNQHALLSSYDSKIQKGLNKFHDDYIKQEKLMRSQSKQEVQKEIDKINQYLSQFAWMDFEITYIGGDKIVMYGKEDLLFSETNIEIVFQYPQAISSMLTLSMDTTKPFIQLSSLDILKKQTGVYAYECHVFQINHEEMDEKAHIYIAATQIKSNIIKK